MEQSEKILDAAVKLYQKKGLKFTMQDVAEECRISKKTIYKIYPSKEDLLLDLVERGFSRIHEAKREVIASDLPIEVKISRTMIALPKEYAELDFRGLEDASDKYPRVNKLLKQKLETNWEPTIQLIEQGIQEGKIRSISIPVLRIMVTSSIETFLSENDLRKNHITYHQALEKMMDIIMKGVEAS